MSKLIELHQLRFPDARSALPRDDDQVYVLRKDYVYFVDHREHHLAAHRAALLADAPQLTDEERALYRQASINHALLAQIQADVR